MTTNKHSLVEEPADPLTVAVDCVEHPGEPQAQNGPSEERREHRLLLPLNLYWGSSQEVGSYAKEGYHTWTQVESILKLCVFFKNTTYIHI